MGKVILSCEEIIKIFAPHHPSNTPKEQMLVDFVNQVKEDREELSARRSEASYECECFPVEILPVEIKEIPR